MMAAEALALTWLAEIEFIRVRQSQIQPSTTLLKKDNNWTQKEFYMQHYVVVPWMMPYQPHSMHMSKPIATQERLVTLLIGPSVILTLCTFLQLYTIALAIGHCILWLSTWKYLQNIIQQNIHRTLNCYLKEAIILQSCFLCLPRWWAFCSANLFSLTISIWSASVADKIISEVVALFYSISLFHDDIKDTKQEQACNILAFNRADSAVACKVQSI